MAFRSHSIIGSGILNPPGKDRDSTGEEKYIFSGQGL